MAKKQKVKKSKAKADPSAEAGDDAAPKKKGGLIGKVALGVALGGASFGTVFFMPGSDVPAHDTEDEAHMTASSEPEPVELDMNPAFVELTPFTISLDGGNGLLKMGITLEASEELSGSIDPSDPQLRDAFTGYLRALKPAQIRDAAYMARLRAQLLRRARLVFDSDAIYGVLITDFLVQ